MKFSTSLEGDTKVIEIFGSINKLDVEELKAPLSDGGHYSKVVLDLSLVDFIDSGFVNLLFGLKKTNPGLFSKLRISNPSEFVAEVLFVTRLCEVCPIEGEFTPAPGRRG